MRPLLIKLTDCKTGQSVEHREFIAGVLVDSIVFISWNGKLYVKEGAILCVL